ncbi:DNA-directed RNA polymerase, subunit E'/Rpb9 [Catovirus CTV1]|uniref:DNA-directed RNA polymerase, subunit E'/Rpb9 n=1 Tax=Catovirus CTV1 TaxID=1977631 RepID=A0A1V0SC25_9VIRU|nr:DNA-directed RNA polymerase, subunit E'/Rpb9 [Catovirus CTV1]
MSGPYLTTLLTTTVNLNPRQMDNKIYKNLKDNLVKKVEGKCYRNFGYISKVYDIKEYTEGILVPENPMAAATFGVKFTCRLCNPLRKKQIVCKITRMNNMLINAQNGPITMIITMNRINSENFYQEPKTGKLMAKKTGHNIEVTPGSYVVTTVESRTFNDMDSIIMAMGELNRLATDEEISDSFKQEYAGDDQVVDFNDYMLRDNEEEEFNEEEDDNMSQDEKEESALQND